MGKTDNELIAEFMGIKPYNDSRYGVLYPDPLGTTQSQFSLFYDKSWDWLMPVVEKCNGILIEVGVSGFDLTIWNHRVLNAKIEDVYQSVIEFIKWYNENVKHG